MAPGVVDLLEVVEVEQQQGAARAGAGAQVEVLGEGRVEPAPVGQPGEHVVVGEVRQALLVAPALGQVDDVDQDDVVLAVLGRDDPAGQGDVHLVEARAGHGPLPHDPRAGDQHGPVQVLGDLVAVVGGQVVEAAPHEGLDGAPGDGGERGVDLQDAAAHVEHRDPVRRVGDEPLGAGVGRLDVVEPPVLVGDVAQHEQGPVGQAGDAVVQRHGVDRDQPGQPGARGRRPRRPGRAPSRRRGRAARAARAWAAPGRRGGGAAGRRARSSSPSPSAEGASQRRAASLCSSTLPSRSMTMRASGMVSVITRRSSAWRRERQPRRGRLADQPVALPLHGRQHQAEQGGQHHERLQGQRLAGDVADVAERAAGGDDHQAQRDQRPSWRPAARRAGRAAAARPRPARRAGGRTARSCAPARTPARAPRARRAARARPR